LQQCIFSNYITQTKKYKITGSEDAIFEPSRSRLEKKSLLPFELVGFPEKITAVWI
jgi:UDP-N-acetylmuramate: L-alanyl-gamma-D-glutamyl-meso-diaminopimelate ligase